MKNQLFKTPETGNIGIIAAIVIVAALFLWQIWEPKLLSQNGGQNTAVVTDDAFCRPEELTASSPVIVAPSYEEDISGLQRNNLEQFVRIKTNVPITPDRVLSNPGEDAASKHLVPIDQVEEIDGKKYRVYYPRHHAGDEGYASYNFTYGNGQQGQIKYADYGIIFLLQLKQSGTTSKDDVPVSERFYSPDLEAEDKTTEFWMFDIFKQSNKPPLPESVLTCRNTQRAPGDIVRWRYKSEVSITNPSTEKKNTLQLNSFDVQIKEFGVLQWFTPSCKPNIYLYPQRKQVVHVKMNPKGYLTETIPEYPTGGWNVTAYPDGAISYQDKTYEYLYYESKIFDEEIKIPQKGYVRKYEELKALYEQILPKLGLNEKETREFVDYWVKVLPKSPYYFVGIMDEASIDHIEPLTIVPRPDELIRVRTYFKALDKSIVVQEPVLQDPPIREGFTVVEWGGMVKTDPSHPFTCSQ